MHGYGRIFYENGETYIGEFEEDKKSGQGMQIHPFKKVRRGTWKNDRFLKANDSPPESPRG